MSDLTVIYLTANEISVNFAINMQNFIKTATKDLPLIVVSKKRVEAGSWGRKEFDFNLQYLNIIIDTQRSHVNIYRNALKGVRCASTKYIAIAEDDILYSPEHFKKRPSKSGVFAYNTACWSIYTWSKPPIYSYSGRRNHGMLICERDLYIEAMEERFAKYPDESKVNNAIWAEPGKYESQLGVTVRDTELFYTDPANVMFSHPKGLSYLTLGEKKRLAPIRALEIPYWGRAEEVVKMYE